MHVLNVTCYAVYPCWCSIYRQLQPPAASRHSSLIPVSTLIRSKFWLFSAPALILQGEGKLRYSCTGHDTSFYFGTAAVLHFSLIICAFIRFSWLYSLLRSSPARVTHILLLLVFFLLLLTATVWRFEACGWRRQTSKRVTLTGRYRMAVRISSEFGTCNCFNWQHTLKYTTFVWQCCT
jgi:hypothetical protein